MSTASSPLRCTAPLPNPHATLTPQQAAEALNVSLAFLQCLLARGDLPCLDVGGEQRVRAEDIVEWRHRSQAERRAALDELAAQAQELRLGY